MVLGETLLERTGGSFRLWNREGMNRKLRAGRVRLRSGGQIRTVSSRDLAPSPPAAGPSSERPPACAERVTD
jgi:hypothetical protein